jgi:multidrug efflux pump subunit AcrA (membrane-fusion protein)
MTIMMGKLYAALREANAPETAAREAAEEAAEFRSSLADIKAEFSGVKLEFAEVKGKLLLLQWMVGFNLAMTVAIVARLFLMRP